MRKELAERTGEANSTLVVDVPHNVVLREAGMNIHRKGATPARAGDLALIPGSMGAASFVVTDSVTTTGCGKAMARSLRIGRHAQARQPDVRAGPACQCR